MGCACLPRVAGVAASLVLFGCGGGSDLNPFETMSDSSTGSDSSDTASGATSADTSSTTSADGSTSGESSADAESENDSNPGAICGDGLVTGNEQCDCGGIQCTPEGLMGVTCLDVTDPQNPDHVLTGGTLNCNPASCRYDVSACVWCGDEEVNGEVEECEPTVEIVDNCATILPGMVGALSCNADCTLDTSACTDCGYQVEFTEGGCPWDWTFAKLHPAASGSVSWECGNPTDYSLGPGVDKTGVLATNLAGPYNANESSLATSPALDLADCEGESLTMTIHHWHNFEGGLGNNDGGIVQISEDGTNWTTLAPISGSEYDDEVINTAYAPPDGEPAFSGNADDHEWVDSVFEVPQLGGGTLHIRFLFGSDGSVQQGGWYVDSIELLGSGG